MNSPSPKRFTKLLEPKYFMGLIKEARRVKYQVVGKPKDFYEVRDNETQDLVFKGMFQGRFWIATFSTLYWQEPQK
jgi:hypothetical protein